MKNGGTPRRNIAEYWENGTIPWLKTGEINNSAILNNSEYITEEGLKNSSAKLLPINSVIMALYGKGTAGRVGLLKFEATTNQACCAMICDEEIKSKYLYYYLLSIQPQIELLANGSVQQNLSKDIIADYEIKVPINSQDLKNIVWILEHIDKKIETNNSLNKNLDKILDLLFKEHFIDNFNNDNADWKIKKIGELPLIITDYVANGSFASLKENVSILDYEDYAYFIRNTDLKSKCFEKFVNKHSYNFLKKSSLYGNEIIISNVGDVGSVFLCPFLDKPMTLGNNMILVKSNDDAIYLNFYLFLLFRSNFGQYLISTITAGSVQSKFNKTEFKSLELTMPDDELIIKFNEFVSPIFDYKNKISDEIANLTKLRDTLLPKLMSGEIDVSKINCDFKNYITNFFKTLQIRLIEVLNMKTKIISKIQNQMKPYLNQGQYLKLTNSLLNSLQDIDIIDKNNELSEIDNFKLLNLFLSAKQVEGCSDKTITYYKSTIEKMLMKIKKQVYNINTDDLRKYLFDHKNEKQSSKTTIDNIRRIFSSFFSWLEDEDYIIKNPVRRIHRVKTGRVVKEVLTDENLEILRDNCEEIRDLAMVELLISTGIRVGELVRLNIEDINFYERECIVFGKGESERIVYFDARTKIHLIEYLQKRNDENPALFVSLNKPYERLGISGVETRLRDLGKKCNINKVHPHKFRRTMATNAIDKGMPIEQVQKLLGHVQIDTTMQYAMVNQSNVKLAHRKFIG
nr:site-specific tyrosine recombinase/integron integrase [uncultured Methanobrevibacter sp.]